MRRKFSEIADLDSGEVATNKKSYIKNHKERIERRAMADVGKNASLAKHMYADLGVAIGEMTDEVAAPYVDKFLAISEIYNELDDMDDVTGIKLKNKIAALMMAIEANSDYFFRWKFTTFKIGDRITYKVTSEEKIAIV